ncbi:hypothetical protein [Macrococcus bovicus]|uniref:hypothetical protein n=1 Tax=Macrococcus bovicus TaxID=69968 RepID=UPI0025A4D38B|nr:hypothetical protein [Macrococcus bovicus]WJP97255.1 hypothetical protein QSV55_08180 [Macrococcus bovicus]
MTYIAGIDFLNTKLSPFVQVKNEYRIRFRIEALSIDAFKELLEQVSSELSTLVFTKKLESYGPVKTFDLHRYIRISSWMELPCAIDRLYFVRVQHIQREDIIQLYRAYRRKKSMPLLMYFYNEQTVMRFSPINLDVISDDIDLIAELKRCFAQRVTEFDGLPVISEEEWMD